MKPIAIFYHCCFNSPHVRIDPKWAIMVMSEQMCELESSGLAEAASEIHVYCQGGTENEPLLRELCPTKSTLHYNYENTTEVPTIYQLRQWLPGHEKWLLFYHHISGVTKPSEAGQLYRRLATDYLIRNWRRCTRDLQDGYDVVGINLIHPKKRPAFPGCFFAGNFWWATTEYLMKLPPIPSRIARYSDPERCRAEMWVGSAWRHGRFMDYERPELYRA